MSRKEKRNFKNNKRTRGLEGEAMKVSVAWQEKKREKERRGRKGWGDGVWVSLGCV